MYQKGIETKDRIMEISRKLFYEQGYKETTTRQIAEEVGVNLGLFSYYFQNKATIATNIYKSLRRKILKCLDMYPGLKKDIKLYTTVNIISDVYLLAKSRKFGKYYYEMASELELKTFMSKMVQGAMYEYYEASNVGPDELSHDVLISMAVIPGAKPNLIYTAHKGDLNLSPIEYANYYMRMYFYFVLNEKVEEAERLLKAANTIVREIDFDITDGFIMTYNKKVLTDGEGQPEAAAEKEKADQ